MRHDERPQYRFRVLPELLMAAAREP